MTVRRSSSSGKFEGEDDVRAGLAGKERALGADHPSTLNTVNNLAILVSATDSADRGRGARCASDTAAGDRPEKSRPYNE